MIGVCFYLNRDLHRNVLNTKPFSRDIFGLKYWKNNLFALVFSLFFYVLNSKTKKRENGEVNYCHLRGTAVISVFLLAVTEFVHLC